MTFITERDKKMEDITKNFTDDSYVEDKDSTRKRRSKSMPIINQSNEQKMNS